MTGKRVGVPVDSKVLLIFRNQWANLLGISVGVLGVVLGYYWYQQSIAERKPILILDPNRIELVNSKKIGEAPLSVFYNPLDGRKVQIKRDLTAITFYFWNAGRAPVKAADILEPLQIVLDDRNASIISAKVLRVSRPVSGWDIRKVSNNALSVSFRILEESDGAACQVIYEGNPKAGLFVLGEIEGVKRIGRNDVVALSQDQRFVLYRLRWFLFYIPGLLMAGMILEKYITQYRHPVDKGAVLFLMFLVTIFGLLGGGILTVLMATPAERNSRTPSVIELIPHSLR